VGRLLSFSTSYGKPNATMSTFAEFQEVIEATYGERDRARGRAATVAWLCEEVGELAKASRKGTRAEQLHELSDVVAWVASLANQLDLSIEEAIGRYANGCPRCSAIPCGCP
jgi:NTP pyrophosphatase (non-canonical NTP hydrolase)